MEEYRTHIMKNPWRGAATCLAYATGAALGAAIRNHSVHDAAIAYLAGGSIIGAIAGTAGIFTVSKSISKSISPETFELGLMYTTIVTAPIMAKLLVDNSSSPMETVADFFIGSTTISALEKGWNYAGTLFGGSAQQTDNDPLLRNITHQSNNDNETNVNDITLVESNV